MWPASSSKKSIMKKRKFENIKIFIFLCGGLYEDNYPKKDWSGESVFENRVR